MNPLLIHIDGLTFAFPADWQASKYDEWVFYRAHFATQQDGIKAVDALAVEMAVSTTHRQIAYLIEVKDYRHPNTTPPSELPQAIATKVLHTLAALLPAKLRANDPTERTLAAAVLASTQLRVIVHLEQPSRHRPIVDLADVQQKLKRLLRAVDPHPKVVCMNNMRGLPWTVK